MKTKLFSSALRPFFHHPLFSQPFIPMSMTALTLLLLVLVLLSVPGPIKGLYWFSVQGLEGDEDGPMTAGVLGWCYTHTSNCTYAPLSDNPYLSKMINTGEALTVRIMLPLACYWMIVTFVFWILLTILSPIGYTIKNLDSITRHLRFAIIEACVLCISLFGNVLCWLAFGVGRTAYLSVENGGGNPKSGHAMETSAVAAVLSLLSLGLAVWGLHLRLRKAQANWKDEAIMVRRRSMALVATGAVRPEDADTLGVTDGGVEKRGSIRWSNGSTVPEYPSGNLQYRGSMVKAGYIPPNPAPAPTTDEEEQLESTVSEAKRESAAQETMIRRASLHDSPYAAAQAAGPN
ncbi:hypothetical protein CI109_102311 [Kwoniella shandongensis]|uniref:Uncharacterized protein n=1 Tax=Kwoniella shandongensis TaxID=1734106 RepID=A0A5M6BQZ7_9TREE|nr:uncharacterized protein CI109_007141 [Kwoniella shandongensis]KAA5524541.1 hypothetical protein CI109_007141 [Kwoniella shandongensis]